MYTKFLTTQERKIKIFTQINRKYSFYTKVSIQNSQVLSCVFLQFITGLLTEQQNMLVPCQTNQILRNGSMLFSFALKPVQITVPVCIWNPSKCNNIKSQTQRSCLFLINPQYLIWFEWNNWLKKQWF